MKRMTVVVLLAATLAGCKDEPARDVQYFLDHSDERAAKLVECENNPGEKAIAANCINAGEADRKARARSQQMPKVPDLTRGQ
ncbi:EexN family lipoprotein [Mesorhizobium sp. RMAD-H1]|uniref:EexN family lipoprotein n=1 Tax=Mesorhizobium sp. RMAD-H1 TaxID=2587065 RepID=UPI00160AE3A1|nr:EexN family lipoprotein [Mesorhizobium sp. RMAD-H1]MBB2973716.1 hypothetical protein [Mesorhizobium sp. RMAD-H1]